MLCILSLVPLSTTSVQLIFTSTGIKRVLCVDLLEYVSYLTHKTKQMDKIFEFLNEDEKRPEVFIIV